MSAITHTRTINSPNSIYHGICCLPLSDGALMRMEIGILNDFIDFLFDHSEHCDHLSRKDAWKEFKIYTSKNSRHREKIKQARKKLKA